VKEAYSDMSGNNRLTVKRIHPFDIFNCVFLGFLAILVIVPFYYTVVLSLIGDQNVYVMNPGILLPPKIDFRNYVLVFKFSDIPRSFLNSFIIVVFGVAYNMFLTITMAYGFSKKKFPGRNFLFNVVVFTMYFGGGLIPFYLLVDSLGLREHLASVIIPVGLSTFNMIILKNFFQEIPPALEESARIDGAGNIRILIQILLPMMGPALATLVLFYSVDRWNEWFLASLFLSKSVLYPIQLQLRQILFTGTSFTIPAGAAVAVNRPVFNTGIQAASIIIIMFPVMMIYPFLQRFFVKGIMIGAIKS
jgi:putative aldouronate transport system permease protein